MQGLGFHPALVRWFEGAFGSPTAPQREGWPAICSGEHTLIAAPTGSGKTLAAFLWALDALYRQAVAGGLGDCTQVLYVSPLKALSNDIQRNLELPLRGIATALAEAGHEGLHVRSAVRTGDTPSSERQRMARRPPHILVTTPESFYLLLTSESGRAALRSVRTVIVDEIHALVANRRGAHLALSLERLAQLADQRVQRIGLSATQRPIEEVGRFLVGTANIDGAGRPRCRIVDQGKRRELDLALELPGAPLEAVMSNEVWEEVHARLVQLIGEHRTTLVFVNTRRLAERLTRSLAEHLGSERVASHHGSLSTAIRHDVESRLKGGQLAALVATASLELGIDIGDVDSVCQIGATRTVSTLLQRVGRSRHQRGGCPKGRLFPLSRDELVECIALCRAARRGELDRLVVPSAPLDILAQQIVASAAAEDWGEEALFGLACRAYPYRELPRERFDEVVRMLADGFATRRGRRGAHLHYDGVNGRLRGRRGARLAALTSGGAIPANADYRVELEPEATYIGSVNEDFAIESMPGDVFQLGSSSWEILRVETGAVRVKDAAGRPPSIPFWLGEAPARSDELSGHVSALREQVDRALAESADPQTVVDTLVADEGLPRAAAEQLVAYLAAVRAVLGALPTQHHLIVERFFDEAGGMQLVIHSPFGGRINRAWGLALRKRFCRSFNFELQAAANEDAIVLSLGETHSFVLDTVFRFLRPQTVRDVLVQALLDAPMFQTRWRWNTNRALAVLRRRGGKELPIQLQRMDAEDLLALVFPDSLACLENIAGERQIPDHPLVQQTIDDCLTEAMDIDGLQALLARIESGSIICDARDLPEPSPAAHEILSARPYAFLDDAPLEERRTRAVITRRGLDVSSARELGALDARAIERVCDEAWPTASSADEVHDALLLAGALGERELLERTPEAERGRWCAWLEQLAAGRRAALADLGGRRLWFAAERLPLLQAIFPDLQASPAVVAPPREASRRWEREEALQELVRGRLEISGPITATELAHALALPRAQIEVALLRLEGQGFVLRGHFRAAANGANDASAKQVAVQEVLGSQALDFTKDCLPASATKRSRGAQRAPTLGEGPAKNRAFSREGGWDRPPERLPNQWCERRLLARIHRLTLDRLRAEIEPVSAADLYRFLFVWQRVAATERLQGQPGLEAVLGQLDGYQLAAASWEADVLPARLERYDPSWLDALCLGGQLCWARLSSRAELDGHAFSAGPLPSTPMALFARENAPHWLSLATRPDAAQLTAGAREVLEALQRRGAMFFEGLRSSTGLLRTQLEQALGELVALGLVTGDGFAGLRALLVPPSRRDKHPRRRARQGSTSIARAGRWSLLEESLEGEPGADSSAPSVIDSGAAVERWARALLRRYGVVFRRLLERESVSVPWRDLARVLRRLEARGEVRGGRFVHGFSGEQFALPDAVGLLRATRRRRDPQPPVVLSAADPLNLVGIITPEARVAAVTGNRVLFEDGRPVAALEGGKLRRLAPTDAADGQLTQTLRRRRHSAGQVHRLVVDG